METYNKFTIYNMLIIIILKLSVKLVYLFYEM